MKGIFISVLLISLVFFATSAMATGSVTITSQVLDSSVRPNGQTTVFLTLANPSTTTAVRTIRLYITSGPYVTPSISYVELGSLGVSSSQQTSLTVNIDSTAISMTSYITLRATYYTDSVEEETKVNIPITIKRIPILQVAEVNYTPSSIEPGNNVNLYFELRNDGDGPAKDVKVILNQANQATQKFIVEGSPETFIDIIGAGVNVPLSFNLVLDPSISVGTYSIPISLAYSDETKTQNYSAVKYLGITITGKYNFLVALDSQDLVTPGSQGSVTIKIANAGTTDAYFLYVNAFESQQFKQITPVTAYIGKLSSDDYDTQKFNLKVDSSTSPGNYPFMVELKYKDPFGNSYSEFHNVTVKVYSPSEIPKKRPSTILILILILIVALVVYLIYRMIYKKIKKK
jgi:hypothetical protein